ncbi:MAG: PEP-CTERM sorting domain-containing protein [Acidobacteriia bacterium]|nr:PEP-CTERM sorting domain-containing protein [Terriglobia bacterium]
MAAAMLTLLSGTMYADTFFGETLSDGTTFGGSTPAAAAASFLTAANVAGVVGTENFDEFPAADSAGATNIPTQLTFGGTGTAALSGSGYYVRATNDSGRFAVSTPNYLDVNGIITMNFNAPITAFGFYGTDIGDFFGTLTLDLTMSDGSTVQDLVPNAVAGNLDIPGQNPESGSLLYFGLTSTVGITSIQMNDTNGSFDGFGFDDFSVAWQQSATGGPSVPEPTSLAGLVGFALLGLTAIRRRKSA